LDLLTRDLIFLYANRDVNTEEMVSIFSSVKNPLMFETEYVFNITLINSNDDKVKLSRLKNSKNISRANNEKLFEISRVLSDHKKTL
jgi:hypothetical protein